MYANSFSSSYKLGKKLLFYRCNILLLNAVKNTFNSEITYFGLTKDKHKGIEKRIFNWGEKYEQKNEILFIIH